MPASLSGGGQRCHQCPKTFSSTSHLRRHEATHSAERLAVCKFCGRQFVRSDVLLRHSKTCKKKDNRSIGPVKRGRGCKACDSCSRGHIACDGDSPCETCLSRGLDCLYSCATQLQANGQGSYDHDNPKLGHPAHRLGAGAYPNPQQRISISFLLNCPHDFHKLLAGQQEDILFRSVSPSGQFTETWPFLFHAFINPSALDVTSQKSGLLYGLDDYPGLSRTSEELFHYLDQAPVASAHHESYRTRTRAFVSEANIMRFVNAFFQYAYSSNPFIHKASFNINTAPRPLVLAILLYGLTYASPENASAYSEYFDVVEYLIFEGPEFQQILRQEEHPGILMANIQITQAAILIIELQGSQPKVETKRRIRVQRLPSLIFVVRLLNLTKTMNDSVLDGHGTLKDYLRKETLVRVMAWVYLLDAHCVIFYHSPPQLRLFEASFGLPMHDAIFDAIDPVEASCGALGQRSHASRLTLRSVVQDLMSDKPINLEEEHLQVNSLFGLFLVLSALHCVLFDLQALASITDTPDALKPIERALGRWKVIWDSRYAEYGLSSPGLSGFMAHALEFWWLGKKLVEHPHVFSMREVAADSMGAFHEMIQSLKAGQMDRVFR